MNPLHQRRSGILLHPTSLPGPHGHGDLGPEAHEFLRFLARAGQSLWQMLPVVPPGSGDSPYDSPSSFAGSPQLVSLRYLVEDGLLEPADLIFAVDSVPAVLAISDNTFIVYTSNIIAILGLRALYFVLSGMMGRFHYLGTGLALILIFIGAKMVSSTFFHLPIWASLGVIVGVLAGAVGLSLLRPLPAAGPPDANAS